MKPLFWRPSATVAVLVTLLTALGAGSIAYAQGPQPVPRMVEIQTIPALAGVAFSVDGRTAISDQQGVAWIQVDQPLGMRDRIQVPDADIAAGVRAKFSRWYGDVENPSSKRLIATLDVYYLVSTTFLDLAGNAVDPGLVTSLTLRSSHGVSHTFHNADPQWLQGTRVVPLNQGLFVKQLYYSVEDVTVGGSNVVNRSQQSFFPTETTNVDIRVMFYSAHFEARDALFGFPLGSGVRLEYPDGKVETRKFGPNAEITLESLPRGDYEVSVEGPGISLSRPVALSRDQDVSLKVISYLDIGVVGVLAGAIGLGLILIPRRGLLRRRRRPEIGLTFDLVSPNAREGRAVKAQERIDERGSTSAADDHYRLLQLDPDAPQQLIAEAYWFLASRLRAEKLVRRSAERELVVLNAAYRVLAQQRRAYDATVTRVVELRRERVEKARTQQKPSFPMRMFKKPQRPQADFYELLRVDPAAEAPLIARAYSILRTLHSAEATGDAPEAYLVELAEARATLLDRARRAAYDESRAKAIAEKRTGPSRQAQVASRGVRQCR